MICKLFLNAIIVESDFVHENFLVLRGVELGDIRRIYRNYLFDCFL